VTVSGGLLAHAVVRLSVEALGELRRTPLQGCGEPLAVSTLKHLDEQTLAVLVALQQAIAEAGLGANLTAGPFRDWGVVAAPRYLGRAILGPAIARFHAEGAWGVSPHLVPHRSLHAISGTVSQFLKVHGPNFGVGGGPGCETELLLAGLSLLASMQLPGLWLLFSRIEPELPSANNGRPPPEASCQAIALALVPQSARQTDIQIELVAGLEPDDQARSLDFDVLAGMLSQIQLLPAIEHPLGRSGRLSLRKTSGGLHGPHFLLPSPPLAIR
jgi:hypothetical protein